MQFKIFNQTFNIQGVDDPDYLLKLVAYVEDKMTELERATNTIDSHRLALLTALHIADDYFRMVDQYQEMDRFIGKKSAEFVRVLEQCTEDAPN